MGQEEFVLPLPIFPILPFLLSSHLLNTIGTPLAPSLYSRLPCSSRLPALACRVSSCLVRSVILFLLLASSPIARFLLPSLPQPVAPTWRSPPPLPTLLPLSFFILCPLFCWQEAARALGFVRVSCTIWSVVLCCVFFFLPSLSFIRSSPSLPNHECPQGPLAPRARASAAEAAADAGRARPPCRCSFPPYPTKASHPPPLRAPTDGGRGEQTQKTKRKGAAPRLRDLPHGDVPRSGPIAHR